MLACHRVEPLELRCRFHVEAADADLERALHLVGALADAGEHDLGRIAAGREHALQLADRHDVEA